MLRRERVWTSSTTTRRFITFTSPGVEAPRSRFSALAPAVVLRSSPGCPRRQKGIASSRTSMAGPMSVTPRAVVCWSSKTTSLRRLGLEQIDKGSAVWMVAPDERHDSGFGMEVKTLSTGDEAVLTAFLAPRVESSMFLLANAQASGLVDRGEPVQGTYVAALEEGRVVGVAAHFWNGMLVLQAADPGALETVARAAVSRSRRDLKGLAGPRSQVDGVLRALDLQGRRTGLDSR